MCKKLQNCNQLNVLVTLFLPSLSAWQHSDVSCSDPFPLPLHYSMYVLRVEADPQPQEEEEEEEEQQHGKSLS